MFCSDVWPTGVIDSDDIRSLRLELTATLQALPNVITGFATTASQTVGDQFR
ncbi:hypothetical protein GCM10010869_21300 [Mesorhizobium tianshanense]|nr:hypothetical protein GCM10010869_21300 [Mesorhizobium tianshanense]